MKIAKGENARHENAGLENAGREIRRHETTVYMYLLCIYQVLVCNAVFDGFVAYVDA